MTSVTAERAAVCREVLAGGERGDEGLQRDVVDRAGVAAGGGVDQVQCVLGEQLVGAAASLMWWVT